MSVTDTASTCVTPSDVLRATALLFETNPEFWTREWYRAPETGCRCTLGAISYVVAPDNEDADPYELPLDGTRALALAAIDALERYLLNEVGFARPYIVDDDMPLEAGPLVGDWNDSPGRTVHEVIGTLRAAARHAEQVAA